MFSLDVFPLLETYYKGKHSEIKLYYSILKCLYVTDVMFICISQMRVRRIITLKGLSVYL